MAIHKPWKLFAIAAQRDNLKFAKIALHAVAKKQPADAFLEGWPIEYPLRGDWLAELSSLRHYVQHGQYNCVRPRGRSGAIIQGVRTGEC